MIPLTSGGSPVVNSSEVPTVLDPEAAPFIPGNSNLSVRTQPVVLSQQWSKSSEGNGLTVERNCSNHDSVIQITETDNPKYLLQNLKAKNRDRPVIAHLNINFLDPKLEPLQDIIKDTVDILLVSETKLDDTFPSGRFFIEGYKEPFRLDRYKNGGGLMFFVHDDLDCKEIKSHKLPKSTEGIFIKLTIRNTKWLIMGGYNPQKKNNKNFLNSQQRT